MHVATRFSLGLAECLTLDNAATGFHFHMERVLAVFVHWVT